jgi:hypothetical protein
MTDPIARMQNAQRLLDDELFNEAFKAVEDHYLGLLREKATPSDLDVLMAFRLVSKIKAQVVGWAQAGKVELSIRDAEAKAKK